jgi:hypothetical protein
MPFHAVKLISLHVKIYATTTNTTTTTTRNKQTNEKNPLAGVPHCVFSNLGPFTVFTKLKSAIP